MSIRKLQALAVVACLFTAPASWAALINYSQNFEGLNQASSTALGDDGWLVGANVFDSGGGYLYNYFSFPAPNGGPAFSGIDIGQGGPNQGAQQLVVYNDYNNGDHGNGSGNLIEAVVFQEQIIGAGDAGLTTIFEFDAKQGNIGGDTTALAFIQVLDSTTFTLNAVATFDTTALGTLWTEDVQLSLVMDAAWAGDILQFGFRNTASNGDDSGMFYDNVSMSVVPIPAAVWLFGSGLGMLGWFRRRQIS